MTIFDDLGVDPDEIKWQDLAACRNIVQVFFVNEDGDVVGPDEGHRRVYDPLFDDYENDEPPYITRQATDEMCLSCDVQKFCYDEGKENKESGVRGGVYLVNGRVDRTRNEHKTPETWRRIREELGRL